MPLPLACPSWDEKEIEAIQAVIASGHYTMGEKVKAFEEAFADHIGSQFAVMVNSGSSANLLAVAALFFTPDNPIQKGDEVIVPAVSWSTTYFPLVQYGLKLRFVDVDPETMNMDLDALAAAISDKTRMVMSVNLLGNPVDYDRLSRIIGDRPIRLVEDNCESLGAKLGHRSAGTFGDLGTFSSFFSHHISTMEGGMVATDDRDLYHVMLALRAHGWTRNLPDDSFLMDGLPSDPFYQSFMFVLPGFNLRPLEMEGAIGLEQLKKLPDFIAARRRNAAHFQQVFANHPLVSIQRETGESSWFGFAIVLRNGVEASRMDLVQALRGKDVDCRPIVAGNFTRNPVIKWIDFDVSGSLDGADTLHDRGIFVGNHHVDVRGEIDALKAIVDGLN